MCLDTKPDSCNWPAMGAPGSGKHFRVLAWFAGILLLGSASVSAQELQEVRAATLGSDQTQVSLRFSDTPPDANIFVIDSPPRIALDLPGVNNAIASRVTEFNMGTLLSVTAVEAGDRTRVILNLARSADYQSRIEGSELILTVGSGASDVQMAAPTVPAAMPVTDEAPRAPGVRSARPPEINEVDFRRGPDGQGRVIVELSRPGVTVDVREQAGRVELLFPRVLMEDRLERRLDVTDFATPVNQIDTIRERDDRVRMIVNARGDYDVLSYQTDRTYVLELAPITEEERVAQRLESAKSSSGSVCP
jgi:type IV pilus assembly protein PilQ